MRRNMGYALYIPLYMERYFMPKRLSHAITPLLAAALLLFILSGCVRQQVATVEPEPAPAEDVATPQEEAEAPDEVADASDELDPADAEALAQADETTLTPTEQEVLEAEPEVKFELDTRDTKEVQAFFKYFTHNKKGRRNFEIWLERSERYLPYVRRVIHERGLPHELVYLPFVESGYNPQARSRAGASGMWQFMPFTGKKYGLKVGWWLDERNDPYKATHAAADYLEKLYDDFGDWYLALAAYNAGEGRVGRAIKRSGCNDFFELSTKRQNRWRRGRRLYYLPRETRYYVPKLIAVIKIVQNLESLGFKKPDWDGPDTVTTVEVPPRTNLKALAKGLGMSWSDFQAHNPAFVEPGSHPDAASSIYLPDDKAAAATAWLDGPDFEEFKNYYTFYRVRRGDSWYRISRRFGVPISVLKSYNNRRSNLIRPGLKLKIPGKGETRLTKARIKNDRRQRTANAKKVHNLAQSRSNYVVQRGDSLWSVAKQYHLSVATLARANGISSRSHLRIGQHLYIPDQGLAASERSHREAEQTKKKITYKVRRGDTLYSIAKRFGVTTGAIQTWNNMRSSRIYPGDRLRLFQ